MSRGPVYDPYTGDWNDEPVFPKYTEDIHKVWLGFLQPTAQYDRDFYYMMKVPIDYGGYFVLEDRLFPYFFIRNGNLPAIVGRVYELVPCNQDGTKVNPEGWQKATLGMTYAIEPYGNSGLELDLSTVHKDGKIVVVKNSLCQVGEIRMRMLGRKVKWLFADMRSVTATMNMSLDLQSYKKGSVTAKDLFESNLHRLEDRS